MSKTDILSPSLIIGIYYISQATDIALIDIIFVNKKQGKDDIY